jgi:hypothetical protein
MLEPRLEEIEQDISKLEQQRSLTLDAADKLRASVQDRQERAVEARAEAETRAEAADEAVTAIVEHRNQVVEPATESAIELFEQAVRAADRLSRESRTPGQLAKAGAARRLAEAQHVRAQGHGRFAALLEDLAGATPPLPRATEYASMGEAQRQAEATSRAEAADRYEEAARALRGAGVRGPEREGLETAAGELEALAAQLRGGGGTPPGEPGGAGNDAATEPATP